MVAKSLNVALSLEGFSVRIAPTLEAGRQSLHEALPDLCLLDVGLPDGTGLELLREVRVRFPRLPVILLTAKSDEDSVVAGLSGGAEDYVRKPYSTKELVARIRKALEIQVTRSRELRFGKLSLELESRKVFHQEAEIALNRREFDLLLALLRRPEEAVSREELIATIDSGSEIFDRTVDSHLSHLRTKLRRAKVDDLKITSVYGVGYRLEKA